MPSLLRALDVDRDTAALHQIYSDEESARYLAQPATSSLEETHALLSSWTKGWEANSWAITDGQSSDALGRVSTYGGDMNVWEIGVILHPSARRRGLARQATAEALDITFERDGARRIFADIDPDNIASIRLFESLGFKLEGHMRESYETHIGVRDALIYGLLRTDPLPWRA
ncbi:GNAT family N-acetyltransferase [Henriciella litoralis]|uniref:GNAT family N-acetyltransferase n=1 Tax=Henriciella litoralis TaxID=568102 RepID=UPI001F297CDC|nr:GNAT family N-acetyltransferase [Henriciella litoralis]